MWWKRRLYLDTASGVKGNPSSPHEEGRCAKQMLDNARRDIARLIEVQADDVIFTSGATESNALAILGIARALRARGQEKIHVLYLPSAHASIVENVKLLEGEGVAIEALPIKEYRVDTDVLRGMLRDETVLVAMEAVCGETGVVWNTREVAETLKARKAENKSSRLLSLTENICFLPCALLHVDASQAPHTEKITRDHFGADTLTFDGAKVGSARGIGALIAHRTIPIEPLYKGGGQERGLRSGTESPELARDFAVALRATAKSREAFRASALRNRAWLIEHITHSVANVCVQEGRAQAPHILNLSLLGRDTDYLVALLDEAGYATSTRSACETDSEEGSRAVFVLTSDRERARTTLRISWGHETSLRELAHFVKTLSHEVAFIDKSGQR